MAKLGRDHHVFQLLEVGGVGGVLRGLDLEALLVGHLEEVDGTEPVLEVDGVVPAAPLGLREAEVVELGDGWVGVSVVVAAVDAVKDVAAGAEESPGLEEEFEEDRAGHMLEDVVGGDEVEACGCHAGGGGVAGGLVGDSSCSEGVVGAEEALVALANLPGCGEGLKGWVVEKGLEREEGSPYGGGAEMGVDVDGEDVAESGQSQGEGKYRQPTGADLEEAAGCGIEAEPRYAFEEDGDVVTESTVNGFIAAQMAEVSLQ